MLSAKAKLSLFFSSRDPCLFCISATARTSSCLQHFIIATRAYPRYCFARYRDPHRIPPIYHINITAKITEITIRFRQLCTYIMIAFTGLKLAYIRTKYTNLSIRHSRYFFENSRHFSDWNPVDFRQER